MPHLAVPFVRRFSAALFLALHGASLLGASEPEPLNFASQGLMLPDGTGPRKAPVTAAPAAMPAHAPQALPPPTPQELWSEALVRWDAAVGAANRATRLSLTKELHRAWLKANPQATQEARLAYLRPPYFRLVGYEVNDDMIYGYVDLCEELQAGLGIAFTKTLSPEAQKGIREIASQRVAVAAAQQRNQPPPAQRAIFRPAQTIPTPSTHPEDMDLASLRRRAVRGEAAAAYDLGMSHEKGYGTPVDKAAAAFWLMRAHEGGFNLEGSKLNTPEGHTATWKSQADQGSVLAMLMYALNLRDGVGILPDQAAANTWLRRAMEAGNRDAAVHLALQLREGQGCDIDLEGSRRLLEEHSPTGHPRVLCELGRVHEGGAGVPRDLGKAAELFLKAAQGNYPWAMKRIADCLLEGRGLAKNPAEAKHWLEKAAALGDPPAQKALTELKAGQYKPVAAYIYEQPREERAVFDLEARRKLAEAGNAAACYDLAYAHWQGLGVRKNVKEGNRWNERAKAAGWKVSDKWTTVAEITESWRQYGEQGSVVGLGRHALSAPGSPAATLAILQRAAEAGYAPAQERLASRLRDGLGTAVDEARAIEWFRRSAALGNAQAQGYLAYAHDTGRGVTRSEQEAARLYRLAAEGGDRQAMANLANVVFHGKGQAAQPREAAAWYLLLAGLPGEEMAPEEAAQRIRAKAERGDPGAYEAWAIVLRRGCGTAINNEEAFAYGFTAVGMSMAAYPLRWFEPAGLKRPMALRRAATVSIRAYAFSQAENSKDASYAARIANGNIPTTDRILAATRRDDSTTVRTLKAISENRLTPELAAACEGADEALALPGLSFLHEEALKRPELASQAWLLRLAGVAEKAADAAAAEKLFQAALLAPAPDQAARERLQTLRRLAAARLYHGIGRAQDRPAALAWAMLSVDTVSDLLALELIAGELNSEQVGLADTLFERISSRLAETPAGR